MADLSDAARLARAGLSVPQPGRRGWHPYQAVGAQLHEDGWRGLIVPGAARPSSVVLVVFLPGGDLYDQVVPTTSAVCR